jgi:hypothetical protein
MNVCATVPAALATLQRQFLAHLRGQSSNDLVAQVDCGAVSRTVGLHIYASAYGSRLREALETDHPLLGMYLGDALWDQLCAGYVATHPSRVRSLRDFGARLPRWLARNEPFRGQPVIAELALFERRLLDSFDAADDACVDWSALQQLPVVLWPRLRLRMRRCVRVQELGWNSVPIWQALKQEQSPPPARPERTCWVLWRDRERVGRFRSIDAAEQAALAHARTGGDFAGICTLLSTRHPPEAVPSLALGYLQTWCGDGLIASLHAATFTDRSPLLTDLFLPRQCFCSPAWYRPGPERSKPTASPSSTASPKPASQCSSTCAPTGAPPAARRSR